MPQKPMEDPFDWFTLWLDRARASDEMEPTAMSLATVGPAGTPTVRIVLLKDYDRKGFVFYTNLESEKGRHLLAGSAAGLNFLWKTLGWQVRIDGSVEQVSDDEADAYFASRPRGSQIGAWASDQSRPLLDRDTLMVRLKEVEDRFAGQPVPRPPHWSGFRVIPARFEFWESGESRLHDRWRFERHGPGWKRERLFP